MSPAKVTRVRGEAIYTRTAASLPPAITGYRYFAVLEDSSEELICDKATERYALAYQWSNPVVEGQKGLAARFTYSGSVDDPSIYRASATFRIEWV